MNFGDFEITKREILVCTAITLILIGLGFIINSIIQNSIYEENETYYKALKIENSEEQFKYAIKTNIGYTLAQGEVQAVEGVEIKDIQGKYFEIRKVKEKYTMHTRQVAHTRRVGNTTQTYYTTETYWTWDYVGEEKFHTEKFNFLGIDFRYETIKFHNETYKETKKVDSNTRYKYYIIPFKFKGTLFTYIDKNTINQNAFYVEDTVEKIIISKQKEAEVWNIGFWIIWVIVIGVMDFCYMYFDNNYLED